MKHKNTNREYAFLMIEYETPVFIKDLQNSIKKMLNFTINQVNAINSNRVLQKNKRLSRRLTGQL